MPRLITTLLVSMCFALPAFSTGPINTGKKVNLKQKIEQAEFVTCVKILTSKIDEFNSFYYGEAKVIHEIKGLIKKKTFHYICSDKLSENSLYTLHHNLNENNIGIVLACSMFNSKKYAYPNVINHK